RIELEFLLLREQSRTWPEEEEPRPRDASRIAVILAFQHIRFERIHPFRDGNGRVGRLLLTASLRQRFQSATLYVDWAARKTEYMDAMKAASRGDLAPLANILLQACGRGPLATPYYWSQYRVAPRMLEH